MKLSLHLSKNIKLKSRFNGKNIGIAVIDLDKSKKYPANFLCVLPKVINNAASCQSNFTKLYGKKSKTVANMLLSQALLDEIDLDLRNEIRDRLKLLNPKKVIKTNCVVCGNLFEQKNKTFRKYKLCHECYEKRYVRVC